MPRLRFRFTMRRLMIALAIVACAFGIETMRRRRSALQKTARLLVVEANRDLKLAKALESSACEFDTIVEGQQRNADGEFDLHWKEVWQQYAAVAAHDAKLQRTAAQGFRDKAVKHGRLARKFQHAAVRPWQSWRSLDAELRTLRRKN